MHNQTKKKFIRQFLMIELSFLGLCSVKSVLSCHLDSSHGKFLDPPLSTFCYSSLINFVSDNGYLSLVC